MKTYYLCGPTVYDYPHIGNLRPILTFDIMIRAQKYLGEEIFFVHNITDIDDKIINKAINNNISEESISTKFYLYYLEQLGNFNILIPDKMPKVTEELNQLFLYIQKLIDNKSAYKIGNNVYFDVQKYSFQYGIVSGQKLENLEFEDSKITKKNKADFALWKDTKVGIKYDSPFGKGRPGWHTECAAFIDTYFKGKTIDIHGGGIDLIFPHHENENIQHYALYNQNIANKWIHFGTLNYKNQKMSKSIGNIIYPHDFLKQYYADTYRLTLLMTNYSKPISMTDELFEANNKLIEKYLITWNQFQLNTEFKTQKVNKELMKNILTLIGSLDFANANKEIFALSKDKNNLVTFFEVMKVLGFLFPLKFLSNEIKEIYKEWLNFRDKKEFQKADELRKILIKEKIL